MQLISIMETFSFGELAYFISKMVYYGFIVFAPILLIVRLVTSRSVRSESVNLLSSVNLTFSIGILIQLVVIGIEFYLAYSGGRKEEYFVFGFGTVMPFFVISGIFLLILILFLFIRFRKSWVLTVIVLILANVNLIMPLLKKLFNDYQPSSWSVYYPDYWPDLIFKTLLFGVISLAMYFILAKTKKLPYPSVWVK